MPLRDASASVWSQAFLAVWPKLHREATMRGPAYTPPPLLPELSATGPTDTLWCALAKVDVKIASRWRSERTQLQSSLTIVELRQAYNRRKEHAEGAHRLHRWATGASGGGLPPPARPDGAGIRFLV